MINPVSIDDPSSWGIWWWHWMDAGEKAWPAMWRGRGHGLGGHDGRDRYDPHGRRAGRHERRAFSYARRKNPGIQIIEPLPGAASLDLVALFPLRSWAE